MTTMSFQSRPVPRRRVKPKIGRTQVNTIDIIAAFALGFLPVVVSVAIVVAAVTWVAAGTPDAAHDAVPAASGWAGFGR